MQIKFKLLKVKEKKNTYKKRKMSKLARLALAR